MGRVGSRFDNAAAEAFFSSLEWEVLSRHEFENTRQAQAVVLDWCYGFYNHDRRHSSAGMMSPVNYENTAAPNREAAQGSPPRFGGTTTLARPSRPGVEPSSTITHCRMVVGRHPHVLHEQRQRDVLSRYGLTPGRRMLLIGTAGCE